ncbi:MAG: glutamate synthase [Chloroflexi bacterium]|nr:glutamate synthase [Chloroflexota bacterium]
MESLSDRRDRRRGPGYGELREIRDVNGLNEHDGCAIICNIRKGGRATHGNVKRTLEALGKMGHRTGDVNGEGDGCGIQTDIPRRLWADYLERVGKARWLAEDRRFFVGHLLIPFDHRQDAWAIKDRVVALIREIGCELLLEQEGLTRRLALGRLAREQEPEFWQVAGVVGGGPLDQVEARLFDLRLAIERETPIHVASLSTYVVVYKVRGDVDTLYHYYPELRSPDFTSLVTIGHSRYSTNTLSVFERVQPFGVLGHNGEINTVRRLVQEARMLGVQLVQDGSDSQHLDRTVETLIHRYGFTLMEAMELCFPPIEHEIDQLRPEVQAVYRFYRQAFGPFAQGPAAIVARYGDECAFSVDALGLRPLWFGETEKEYFFSSERGVVPLDMLNGDPKPLAPGEKMVVRLQREGDRDVEVLDYIAIQDRMARLARRRYGSFERLEAALQSPEPRRVVMSRPDMSFDLADGELGPGDLPRHREAWMAAFGWDREDRELAQTLAGSGSEPIGSLGYDGPLAALDRERRNLADYFKEAVAVVTNPSIDREREMEHFSTRVLLGPRPELDPDQPVPNGRLVLDIPIVLGGHPGEPLFDPVLYRRIARDEGTYTLEDLEAAFGRAAVARISITFAADEPIPQALDRLADEAVEAVRQGAELIILDDGESWSGDRLWLDPHLCVAVVDRALREAEDWPNLRRRAGLVLRSGAIRNLHDLIMALGLGADAVNPYLLLETATDPRLLLVDEERGVRLVNLLHALRKGLEKVTSTMGIHELRGYGRIFASIGLSTPVAEALDTLNYFGSEGRGLTWDDLARDSAERAELLRRPERARLSRTYRMYPKVWKTAGQVAQGTVDYEELERRIQQVEREQPISIRHVLEFRYPEEPPEIRPEDVDCGLTGHDLPFVIASMSFGSQGETAFRAYAEAAYRLNIICLNGEGGEPKDMLGKYPHNRGQQVASGRFGVNIELLNSSNLLEIKIGQGAKPGEGGHLPGRKVSAKVAAARNARRGVDLISPSNNHDLYSIEDLAQFIEELKTANPRARVAVKVPVVPGIGIIAVGIAKAKADIINLSGFDGGTGAARKHALRHVGLPVEIGVMEAHRALSEAGLRHKVEIWCDGGIKSATDVVKMMCLGANRVGFGTLAMVAIGCTICRQCQMDTCHVGIATQMESLQEAMAKGLKRFVPQNPERAVERLVRLFGAMGDEVRRIVARLGYRRAQDLVGHAELLHQARYLERLDLTELLTPVGEREVASLLPAERALRRPRNYLTALVSGLVMEAVMEGETVVAFEDDRVTAAERALGTHLAGELVRRRRRWNWPPRHSVATRRYALGETKGPPSNGWGAENGEIEPSVIDRFQRASLHFHSHSMAGNGLGAFTSEDVRILVEGGAQDGVAKCGFGGLVAVLRGMNHNGLLIDGSVGKGFAYGAQRGMFIVEGNADSRACIRLSGADVVIGGEITEPLRDHLGFIGTRANVKGFLCEYMTDGRVVVLGDPGPWICAGMTGGVLYLRLNEAMGLDREAIRRRLAAGARVELCDVTDEDEANLRELLGRYIDELVRNHRLEAAERVRTLLEDWRRSFVKIVPKAEQVDQSIATE